MRVCNFFIPKKGLINFTYACRVIFLLLSLHYKKLDEFRGKFCWSIWGIIAELKFESLDWTNVTEVRNCFTRPISIFQSYCLLLNDTGNAYLFHHCSELYVLGMVVLVAATPKKILITIMWWLKNSYDCNQDCIGSKVAKLRLWILHIVGEVDGVAIHDERCGCSAYSSLQKKIWIV